jgi:DNA-binding XRE family transcriptional regulator
MSGKVGDEHMEIQFDDMNLPTTAKDAIFVKSSDDLPRSQNTSLIASSGPQSSNQAVGSALLSPEAMDEKAPDDADTAVSSLTGHADQEIVEELHQALTELRAELEASRAEAARAVKVAEQAIQSAENNNSRDWNATVTHKAAEAAALAQKKAAEALAKARLAEERLTGERRTAAFWRKQAEAAEEEAGILQTRAAAAEVQRAALAEELESEKKLASIRTEQLQHRLAALEGHQREALESAMERNRVLEIELDGTRRNLQVKDDEAKNLHEELSEL